MSTKFTFDELLQCMRAGRDFSVGRPFVVGEEIRWPQRFGGHLRPPQSRDIWADVQAHRDASGPMLSPIGFNRDNTTCTPHEWEHLRDVARGFRPLDAVYEEPWQVAAPAPAPAVSPAYGPAGKPSPGRRVRYRAEFGDTPAIVHHVLDEATGQCVLCLDIVAPAHLPGRFTQVTRISTMASFGSDVGQWDYWPHV